MKAILSIDQSTSATKSMVWSLDGKLLARRDLPHRQFTTSEGWIEHDAREICDNALQSAREAIMLSQVPPGDIAAIGISNQRETAVCWDRATGQPLHRAIVWQCARAADITGQMEDAGLAPVIRGATGLPLSPYFSAAKFGWMLRHVPEVAQAKQRGALCCGTVDSWLIFQLTGQFRTEYSNASRTQLLNLDTLRWDESIAEMFGLSLDCLPEIADSDSFFGATTLAGLLPKPTPVHGVMGDSHAALFGNHCLQPGLAKATYGTGSSVMMHAGYSRPPSGEGVATSLAWGLQGQVAYVLEGNINYTGAVTAWLAEDVGLIDTPLRAGEIAQTVKDTGGVYLIPAFSGLGAPYFNNGARAALVGMQRGTQKAHIVRAAEECIAYQICDVVNAINACCPQPMTELYVDGGPTQDRFLMQFQSDMLDIPLLINETAEVSAKGAADCAALGAGLTDAQTLLARHKCRKVQPAMEAGRRQQLYTGWKNAVGIIDGRMTK